MRLIDADEVHNLVRNSKKYMWRSPISTVPTEIKVTVSADTIQFGVDKIPTIDAEPVRHARWVDNHCAACGMMPMGDELWKLYDFEPPRFELFMDYCPNCGATMNEDFKGE